METMLYWFVFALIISLSYGGLLPSRSQLFRMKDIWHIINIRSGNDKSPTSVWYHNGVMRNPLTGSAIAGIEGLELNRYVGSNVSDVGNSNYTFSSQYLSKKIFVYTDVKENSTTTPLRRFKVQLLAPFRKVQPVKAFSDLVTLTVNESTTTSTIQFPNNRSVVSRTLSITSTEADTGTQYNIVHFISGGRKRSFTDLSKWISFAKPSDSGSGRNQEYYTLTDRTRRMNPLRRLLHFPKPSNYRPSRSIGDVSPRAEPLATMKYIRYGECPSWYSLHKPCTIEVDSWKYRSLDQCPPHILPLISSVSPTFLQDSHEWTALTSSPSEALKAFREQVDIAAEFKPWYTKLRDIPGSMSAMATKVATKLNKYLF